MLIDAIDNQKTGYAKKFSLMPWQQGVISEVIDWVRIVKSGMKLSLDKNPIKSVNMGKSMGHTYLARVLALIECPVRSKVYTVSTMHLSEFNDLVMKPEMCHEPIDIIHCVDFAGYHGDPVDLVVVDCADESISQYHNSLQTLMKSLPITTMILLLQLSIL